MNPIKSYREKFGYTQQSLAQETGLSLRTIQRLENDDKAPKGHSLQQLATAFELNPAQLKEEFSDSPFEKSSPTTSIQLVNLAVLGVFVFPFGNLILPYLVWRKNRADSLVNETGKRILNFQIYWNLLLILSLCVSPFLDPRKPDSLPLIFIVLILFFGANLFVTLWNAWKIQNGDFKVITPPIRFI